MESKEYKISELVDIIGVSKATIYNKVNGLKSILKKHTKVRKGITYIDFEGLEIIKGSIGVSREDYTQTYNTLKEELTAEPEQVENIEVSNNVETIDKYVESLENQLVYLKSIIAEKDKQLDKTAENTANLTRLLENSQVLLKQSQEKILLLENPPEDKQVSFWTKVNPFKAK